MGVCREFFLFSGCKTEPVSPTEVNNPMSSSSPDAKKEDETDQQGRTKMLVRNVPFQATSDEVQQLFSAFGEIKFIRMPKKVFYPISQFKVVSKNVSFGAFVM